MIVKLPCHRPERKFSNIKRIILECSLIECVHCGTELRLRRPRHMRKTVQTMDGAVFVAGKSKECTNPSCTHFGKHYYATGVLKYSLPYSTYGLDVLAFIGWQHENEHQQLVEIQRKLNQRGVEINESNVGKLYRQFLALLGGTIAHTHSKLAATADEHGGLIWAIDALQPEGHGTLLYVLYEVLSGTPVKLLQKFVPDPKQNPAQFTLKKKLQRLWHKYGANLLHCYDIPGLPPDNLKMEAMFSHLGRHQRRISGRKSTAELRDFGQYQVLFLAESEKQLLEQIQQVPLTEYKTQRLRLAASEASRQQKRRLHRNPVSTIQALVNQHQELLTVLEFQALEY